LIISLARPRIICSAWIRGNLGVRHLVFAKPNGDALRLGGRKIKGYQYRGLGIEHIAAIWQAERKNPGGGDASTRGKSAGFSLDPDYKYGELKQFFDRTLAKLDSAFLDFSPDSYSPLFGYKPLAIERSNPDAKNVSDALDRCQIDPFLTWISNLRRTRPELVELLEKSAVRGRKTAVNYSLEELLMKSFTFQRARYDGDLQGTEVGMILFYTDLVAKLWDFDFKQSAPRTIEDFKSEVEIRRRNLSEVYAKQLLDLRFGRLWFGPDSRGYQAANDGEDLLFARRSTKLFAKSSGGFRLQDEVEPDAATAQFINWWDAHYEEVARYEPEYERLNQIMKWSLLVSWLERKNNGSRLSFLGTVTVRPSPAFEFRKWAEAQPSLRFNRWDQITFLKNANNCGTTESLTELTSDTFAEPGQKSPGWVLEGGVSLGSEEVFAERTFLTAESKVAPLARRSMIDYAPLKSGENMLQTVDGAKYEFNTLAPERVMVTSTPKSGSMLRTSFGDLAPAKFEHVVQKGEAGLRVEAKYGETPIGNLTIEREGNVFQVGWQSREVDTGQTLARELSRTPDPASVLTTNPGIDIALKLEGSQGYLVKLRSSDNWLRLRSEVEPSSNVPEGWQARFAEIEGDSKPIEVAWWDAKRAQAELRNGYVVVRRNGMIEVLADSPKAGKPLRMTVRDRSIEVSVNLEGRSATVKFADLPEDLQRNPSPLQRALTRELNKPSLPADSIVNLNESSAINDETLYRLITDGRYRDAAESLAVSPADFKKALESRLSDALGDSDELLASRKYEQLQDQLNEMIDLYGARPELMIRKGVASIRAGNVKEGVQVLAENIGQAGDPQAFLREINTRLKSGMMSSDSVIQFRYDPRGIAAQSHLSSLSGAAKVSPDAIDLNSALVYVQDAPGFNNLDWTTNVEASLHQVISGDLGDVFILPKGNLNNFRPVEIYVTETSTTFHSVREATAPYRLRIPIAPGLMSRCSDDKQSSDACGNSYVVVARSRS
jgi:hypothetical protein